MKDIFLSRPNWISPKYERGLYNFYKLLKSNDVNPRTIGQSDYPNKSPLEEVIYLMKKCYGTIILGIPQIEIIDGKIKGENIQGITELGTEWNHIEAALAYSIGHTLLIICHTNVCRGIFDRGACNSYLYTVDMTDPFWAISDTISGAVLSWKSKLAQPSPQCVKRTEEKPTLKWGMYQFDGEPGLYCPVCYQKTPNNARVLHPSADCENDDHVSCARSENRHKSNGQHHGRKRQLNVGDVHDDPICLPPVITA